MAAMPILPSQTADSHKRCQRGKQHTRMGARGSEKMQNVCACVMERSKE